MRLLLMSITLAVVMPLHVLGEEEILRWQNMNVKDSGFFLEEDSGKNIIIDGSVNKQVIVKVANRLKDPPSITYMCYVNTLRDDMKITEAKFCRYKASKESCENMQASENSSTITIDRQYKFSVIFDAQNGANITSFWKDTFKTEQQPDYSGLYYCVFSNRRGSLKSAPMEIQDMMVLLKFFPGNKNLELIPHEKITPNMLPLTLPCTGVTLGPVPDDVHYNIQPIMAWKFCKVSVGDEGFSPTQCQRQLTGENTNMQLVGNVFVNNVVHLNGSLTIFTLSNMPWDQYALICYNPSDISKWYTVYGGIGSEDSKLKPLLIDGSSKFSSQPIATGPTEYSFTIREGHRPVPFALVAYYRADYGSVRVRWTKDGQTLPGLASSSSQYQYTLGTPSGTSVFIGREMAGEYQLQVGYRTTDNLLTFTFRVKVKYPPFLKAVAFVPVEYVMEGGNVVSKWDIQNADIQNGDTVKIFINGAELSTGSKDDLVSSWQSVKSRLSMSNLNFAVEPLPITGKDEVTYKVNGIPSGHSHVVTFEAQNDVGIARWNKLIRVVRQPEFKSTPQNCTVDCLNTKPHSFHCELDPVNRQEILSTGVQIRQTWFSENDEISEERKRHNKLFSYFTVENTTTLILKEVMGSDEAIPAVRKRLANTTITCVVELFDPDNSQLTIRPRLYDSRKDAAAQVKADLTARLMLTGEIQILTASLSWLWAIILAMILILIIASLITYMCLRKKEGATYLVDEQERAQGNDPEKEIIEKEVFHTYERVEDFGAGDRLSVDQNSMGVHSDNEREDFEPDAEKYNEDGSYIYNYGANQPNGPQRPLRQ